MKRLDDNQTVDEPGATVEELRHALVQHQARTVGWWLAGIAILLGFLTVFVAVAGLISIGALRGLRDDARQIVSDIREDEDAIADSLEKARDSQVQAEVAKGETEELQRKAAAHVASIEADASRVSNLAAELQRKLQSLQVSTNQITDGAFNENVLGAFREFEPDGYGSLGEVRSGQLTEGDSFRFRQDLAAERNYLVIGVCDENCSDFDLKLYSDTNELVEEDVLPDGWPILQFVAQEGGFFNIEVSMFMCRVQLCNWGARVYVRSE